MVKISTLRISSRAKRIMELYERDARVRGDFIVLSIHLEDMLASIIAGHFCSRRSRRYPQLFSILSNHLSFSTKITIARKLLKHEYPELFTNYPDAELNNLRDFRNRIAHSPPEDLGVKGFIPTPTEFQSLDYFKPRQKTSTISRKQTDERFREFEKAFTALTNINAELSLMRRLDDRDSVA